MDVRKRLNDWKLGQIVNDSYLGRQVQALSDSLFPPKQTPSSNIGGVDQRVVEELAAEYVARGMGVVVLHWETIHGNRPPYFQTPDGEHHRINYMKDGTLITQDGISGIYHRLVDDFSKPMQSALIAFK